MGKATKKKFEAVRASTASQIKEYLINRYLSDSERIKDGKETRTSHILIGPPGVGKTRAVMEAGQEIARRTGREFLVYDDRKFFDLWSGELTELGQRVLEEPERYFVNVVFPLNLAEPTDLTGIPQVVGSLGIVRFYPHFWIKICAVTPGFLVLDDFLDTQREDTLSVGYRVILDKVLGFTPMHRDRAVIATSNTPEHSSLSRLMPVPLATRWEVHEISAPSVDEWEEWMKATFGEGWDKRIYAFLKAFEAEGSILKLPSEPETAKPYPCPRSWTEVARGLHFGPVDVDGLVGPEWGQKLRAFLSVEVNVEELMEAPEKWGQLEYDAKCMACCMLASWLQGGGEIPKALPLLKAISGDSREFLAILGRMVSEGILTKLILADRELWEQFDKVLKVREKIRGTVRAGR